MCFCKISLALLSFVDLFEFSLLPQIPSVCVLPGVSWAFSSTPPYAGCQLDEPLLFFLPLYVTCNLLRGDALSVRCSREKYLRLVTKKIAKGTIFMLLRDRWIYGSSGLLDFRTGFDRLALNCADTGVWAGESYHTECRAFVGVGVVWCTCGSIRSSAGNGRTWSTCASGWREEMRLAKIKQTG